MPTQWQTSTSHFPAITPLLKKLYSWHKEPDMIARTQNINGITIAKIEGDAW
jgi:hypothetical protein